MRLGEATDTTLVPEHAVSAVHQDDDFDRLHLVQAQLAAAQKEEMQALQALTSHTRSGSRDPHDFEVLQQAAWAARRKTNGLFAEWKRLVRRFTEGSTRKPA